MAEISRLDLAREELLKLLFLVPSRGKWNCLIEIQMIFLVSVYSIRKVSIKDWVKKVLEFRYCVVARRVN